MTHAIRSSGGAQSPKVIAIDLKRDEKGRPRGLVLTLVSSVLESMPAGESDSDDDLGRGGIDFLQCYTALPFKAESSAFAATAQLIAHINKSVPLMGFTMDTATREVYFRTMLMFEGTNLSSTLVIEAVRTIEFLLSEFGGALEAVAMGRQSADAAIKALNEAD